MLPGIPNWQIRLTHASHAAVGLAALLLFVAGFLFWWRDRRWEFGVFALAALSAGVIRAFIVFTWHGPQLPQSAAHIVAQGHAILRGWIWPAALIGALIAAIKICLSIRKKGFLPAD